jgi:hypothetical protein
MTDKPMLLDQLSAAIRVRHYSIRTEKTYCSWVYRYCKYHNMRHPMEMGAKEINQYLSHLATDRNVASSTQRVKGAAATAASPHALLSD